jgi:hypothetical protein
VQHLEVLVPVMIMVMPVIERPVSDATDAAPLDAGPLSREVRTSIICSLMPAFDPRRHRLNDVLAKPARS